jgi:hypothetical protein
VRLRAMPQSTDLGGMHTLRSNPLPAILTDGLCNGRDRMIDSLRFSISLFLIMITGAALACDDSTSPDTLPPADLHGSFVLVRAAGALPEQICFGLSDPPRGEMISLGLLTFDTTRSVVRQQERRLEGFACLGQLVGDTIVVDQERSYDVKGPLVLVTRTSGVGDAVVDTGALTGGTLVLRRNGYDFVYERATPDDAIFFLATSDLDAWMVGGATFSSGASSGEWDMAFWPTHFTYNQRIYFFRPAGRPSLGAYQVGHYTSAPFYVRISRDIPGGAQIFESTSGTITITVSTPERMAGSFTIDLVDGADNPTRIEGSFVARCSASAGCR